ncbi:unnamed protein product, partial [Closterium sp. NIES-53]
TWGKLHTQHRCFSRLDDAWRGEIGDEVEHPRWADLLRSGVAIFDLDYDAILSAMYALSASAKGDCYRCVPPDPGIAAAALGASESGALPSNAPAQALHTFTLDSGASCCFFRDSTTLTPLPTPVSVRLAHPSEGRVVARFSTVLPCPAVLTGSLSGLHLPSFSTNLVSTAALQDAMVTTTTPGGVRVSSGSHLLLVSPPVAPDSSVAPPPGSPLPARFRGMHSRLLFSGLPRSLPPLPASPAPPCLPCVEGRQCAAPHSSSFPPTTSPLQTLHMDVWGPALVSGQGRERHFLLVVDDYTRYTTVFPLRRKGEVVDVLILWICTVCLQLRERFRQDLLVLRLHSDRGGEFSSDLLRDFCRGEGILQSFTLPDSPQQNGIAERRIGLVMEVARTSMIHAATPHFLWPFAVRYAAHQLNFLPRVSLPETSPTLRWTGEVGDASVFRVWGSRAFVRDTSADKLSARAIPCDVTFDESVPFYCLFPYRPPPPPPLFLAPGPPPVDPLPPQGPAPSGVSWVDPLPSAAPVEAAVGSGAARGAVSGGAESGGAEPRGVGSEGTGSGGAEPGGEEPGGGESEGAESGGAEPWGAASSGATGAGGAGAGAAGVTAGAGVTGVSADAGPRAGDPTEPGAAGAGGSYIGGAGARGAGVGGTGAGGAGAAGAGAVDPGAGGAGGTVRPRPYFVPLLQQVLSVPPSTSLTPPLLCPPPDQSQPPLLLASPLPAPSPYTQQSGGLTEHREPTSRPVSPVRTACLAPRSRPPPVPGTHSMALRPSSVPLRVPLPAPPEYSLPESAAASALVAELLDFAVACRLDYATSLIAESASASPSSIGGECALGTDVLEDRQEDFECLAAAVPCFASMLLAPEGDPDAPDIPTLRSYAEAITGPYSSQWQAAMDAEMASWKSTSTYVNEVPPPRANIVDGMWIFRSLDFSTAFLQGSLHEEIWLRLPRGFTGSFPAGTQWSLRRPVYGLRQAPREWHDTLRMTLAALGFAPATADPSLFLRTDTSLLPFYVLVYVDDLVFATANTEALTCWVTSVHPPRRSRGARPTGRPFDTTSATAAIATATAATAASACCTAMASLRVLEFNHEGRPVQFDTWLDDLQLYLLSDSKDSVSLFDLASGAAPAPPATADSATRSHTSTATTALGRLLLPYLFPVLSAFATVEDLVSHLRTSDARYRATVPAEFLDRNQPPMFITLYFIVTRLPDSLHSVRDHFLSLDPTSLTVDLLEQHLLAGETIAVARSLLLRTSGLLLLVRSAAAARARMARVVEVTAVVVEVAAGVVVGAEVEVVEAAEVVAAVGLVAGVGALVAAVEEAVGVVAVKAVGLEAVGLDLGMEALLHPQHRCFSCLDVAWRAEFGDDIELPHWTDLLMSRISIFDLDFDAILSAMYALSVSAEDDCYWCVPLDPGIAAAALGASESGTLPGTAPAQALHTFTLDSGDSRCFFRDSTTLPAPIPIRLADPSGGPVVARSSSVLPCPAVPSGSLSGLHLPSFSTNLVSTAALQDAMVTTTTPGGQRVSICTRTGRHMATFTRQPRSSLCTLATKPPQVAASAQVSASVQVAASCSCRLLSHKTLLWHHRLGHPSLPRLRGMHSRLLVSGLPRSLPPLPPSPASPCISCVVGRQRAAPYSSSFPPTTAPLKTLHMDVWGPARVSGQGREHYFLLLVDDYTRYTTVLPLRGKGGVVDVLIPWIRTVCLQLRERFNQDLPVLHLHSDRGGEFSSELLLEFCQGEGILQSFTLPDSPQQSGIAECRIGLVMEVARTSMIHAAAPHFLWPFVVRPRVSLPETSPTLRWTGEVGDASVFRVWGSRAFVCEMSADNLSPRAIPASSLAFSLTLVASSFTTPPRAVSSRLRTSCSTSRFPSTGPAPSGVSQVDPLPGTAPVEVAVGSCAAPGAASGGAASGGAEPGGAGSEGAGSGAAEPEGVELGGAELEGAESGGAEPQGAASSGGPAGASQRLSPQQLREWLVRRACLRSGAPGAGDTGDARAGGAGVTAGAGGTGVTAATGPGGACTRGAGAAGTGGARAGGAGVGGTGAGGAGAAGAGAVDPGAGGAGGTVRSRPYFVPLLQQVLSVPPSASLTPPLLCPPPDQSQPPLQPASSLPAPSSYTEQSGGLTEHREPASRPVSPVRTARRAPRSRPPPVPGMHAMALRPSSVPLRVPLPTPLESSLPEVPDPEFDRARAAIPTVSRLLATAFIDPSFESAAASALVAELLNFAAACLLDYATTLVAKSASVSPMSAGGECALGTDVLEDRQEDFECLAAAVPRFASMLLAPEGDPDAPDIPTPRSYAEAIMGTYVDEVPPPGANIVDGMWIFRVKRPPGSPHAFKARYVARGVSQRQGVDYFETFSPTPKMTTLRVLLHVTAHRDYELHCLDFTTAFLQGSLHEEIWQRRPPGFTGTTLAALGFAPATAHPSLFLRTDTSLPPFYVPVSVDDLVFATADIEALTLITWDRAQRTITLTQSHMVHQVVIAKAAAGVASDYWVHDLPRGVVLKDVLAPGRFLKTLDCFHHEGRVIVKVFLKRADLALPLQASHPRCHWQFRIAKWPPYPHPIPCCALTCALPCALPSARPCLPRRQAYEQQLKVIRHRLSGIDKSHVWPFQVRPALPGAPCPSSLIPRCHPLACSLPPCLQFSGPLSQTSPLSVRSAAPSLGQKWYETERAAYVLRQYLFSTLHDRLGTRPFLGLTFKKWIAFQVRLSWRIAFQVRCCLPGALLPSRCAAAVHAALPSRRSKCCAPPMARGSPSTSPCLNLLLPTFSGRQLSGAALEALSVSRPSLPGSFVTHQLYSEFVLSLSSLSPPPLPHRADPQGVGPGALTGGLPWCAASPLPSLPCPHFPSLATSHSAAFFFRPLTAAVPSHCCRALCRYCSLPCVLLSFSPRSPPCHHCLPCHESHAPPP